MVRAIRSHRIGREFEAFIAQKAMPRRFLIHKPFAIFDFLLFTEERRKNGGSERWRSTKSSACAVIKNGAVAAATPPAGERSVCGMFRRHNAAVPLRFVENL